MGGQGRRAEGWRYVAQRSRNLYPVCDSDYAGVDGDRINQGRHLEQIWIIIILIAIRVESCSTLVDRSVQNRRYLPYVVPFQVVKSASMEATGELRQKCDDRGQQQSGKAKIYVWMTEPLRTPTDLKIDCSVTTCEWGGNQAGWKEEMFGGQKLVFFRHGFDGVSMQDDSTR